MAGMTAFMQRQPKWLIDVIGLILVAFIGYIDYLTGDYSILVFYLLPVSFVSWFSGRWHGAIAAIAGGAARFVSDFSLDINPRHLYWNSFEDTCFLLIVAFLIALLRKALESDSST
jgi:K+-sensing histidine kinase KdpD